MRCAGELGVGALEALTSSPPPRPQRRCAGPAVSSYSSRASATGQGGNGPRRTGSPPSIAGFRLRASSPRGPALSRGDAGVIAALDAAADARTGSAPMKSAARTIDRHDVLLHELARPLAMIRSSTERVERAGPAVVDHRAAAFVAAFLEDAPRRHVAEDVVAIAGGQSRWRGYSRSRRSA